MTLKPIMIERFNSNSKPCARLHWSSSILFNPPLKYTAKTTFTKKRLGSKIPCCHLKIIKWEFSKPRSNFKFLFKFGSGWIAFCITSGCRWDYWSNRLVSACIICRSIFCWPTHRTNIWECKTLHKENSHWLSRTDIFKHGSITILV